MRGRKEGEVDRGVGRFLGRVRGGRGKRRYKGEKEKEGRVHKLMIVVVQSGKHGETKTRRIPFSYKGTCFKELERLGGRLRG